MNKIKDSWESGDPYEYFMGRWSRLVTKPFLTWLSPYEQLKWLDVGCGSGALSEAVQENYNPVSLRAVDQSEGFVKSVQERLGNKAICKVGDALDLPIDDSSIDITVSGLVLNFISKPEQALSEMKRVTSKNGLVAIYIWDYPGKMEFLNLFWNCAVELDKNALSLHEGSRFPNATSQNLRELFESTHFVDIACTDIIVKTEFKNFDDYWNPFLGGQGPAPTYLHSLTEKNRNKLKEFLHESLPIQSDGTIPLIARAWAVKGKV